VQEKLGDKYLVKLAMNYGEPGIRRILKEAVSEKMIRIIPFPLYPQYASSTTGSALEKILKILSGEKTVPAISSVLQYYNDPLYIKAMAARIAMFDLDLYDHIVISFHGLPLSHVRACHEGKSCDDFNCISEVNRHNRYCYHATCYATARQLVREIQIDERKYTVCFQSRIARNWLRPFADETIQMLAKEGKKKLLFICPSFTSDCLETIVEVGYEYRELFLGLGGEKLDLVPSLNDSEAWVEAVRQIILSHSPESTP
jgi:ferrochelatase